MLGGNLPIHCNFEKIRPDLFIKETSKIAFKFLPTQFDEFTKPVETAIELIENNSELNPYEKEIALAGLYGMSKTSKSKKLDVLCIHCQSQLNSEYYCISCRMGVINVALKTLLKSSNPNENFFKEALSHSTLGSNSSRTIVQYFGMTKSPTTGNYMMVMAYMDGGSLDCYLKNKKVVLTWEKIYSILYNISTALLDIHNNNMVHRDLHPGNIIHSKNIWVVCDLGLCGPSDKETFGQLFGIVPYVAPEVLSAGDFSAYTQHADIYSLGIIMWQLTSRNIPFYDHKYDERLSYKIRCQNLRPSVITGTPKDYEEMMKRCWDSDVLLRPDAIEFNKFCMLKLKQIHDGLFTDPELNTFASPPNLSSGFVNEMKSKLLCLNYQQSKDEYNHEFKDSKEINLTINSSDEDHIDIEECVNEHDKIINQLNDSSGQP
ncbi:7478_t:CDS:2, partial [Gigaspora rosea]